MFFSYILIFTILLEKNRIVSPYLIFPLEYLPLKNYKFIRNNNIDENIPEEVIKKIYYKNIITKLEIGTPSKKYPFLIETNKERFYLSNFDSKKESKFYLFEKSEYYNESESSTYVNTTSENKYSNKKYNFEDLVNFNINKKYSKSKFPLKIELDTDENPPGYIGLLYNDSNYEYSRGFITELKMSKLIDNHYWFFDFDEFVPLDMKIKGRFIVGNLSHEVFPKKYSFDDLETTSSAEGYLMSRAWHLNLNKIYIDNEPEKTIELNNKIMTFEYEIYNIIASMEFHFEIRDLFMDKLVEEKKCFISNFSQNIYSSYNLTFYYCLKSTKDILYQKMPNLKFSCVELDYIFELTKEELFYEKGDYIYFMILFTKYESITHWIMGQIFTSKYNFVFNSDKKQIGFYKKVNHLIDDDKIDKKNYKTIIMIIAIICLAVVFTIIGLVLGKKIFGMRRKIIANELTDELEYDYKINDDNNYITDNNQNNLNEK